MGRTFFKCFLLLVSGCIATGSLLFRDVYPGTLADPRIKPVRFLVSKKRRNPEFTTKHLLVRFNIRHSVGKKSIVVICIDIK